MRDEAVIEEFLDTVAAGKVGSPLTLTWYSGQLGRFFAWCAEHDKAPFTVAAYNGFIAYLKRDDYELNTIRGYVVILKRLGRWLVEREYVTHDPGRELQYPEKPRRILRAILPEDYAKLLAAVVHERDRALVLLLHESGARSSEIITLHWCDIRVERGRALVVGKRNKERPIYFKPDTSATLLKYRETVPHEPDDPVWWSLTKPLHPLTYTGLYLMLKRLGARAGVERFNPHAFRHAFGRQATKNGCPTLGLQDLMGHASPETTRLYSYLDENDLADMHARYVE